MFCNKCGYFLSEKDKVCPKCGEPVDGAKGNPKKAKNAKNAKESKKQENKKSKKPIIIAAVALVLVAAIVISIVALTASVKPIKILEAAEETLYESEKLNITIVDNDKNETTYIVADFGKDTSDTLFEVKRQQGDGEATLVFCLKDGNVTTSKNPKEVPIKTYIESRAALFEDTELDLDYVAILDEIINNKIDKGAVEKVYNKDGRMLLGLRFSIKFEQDIDLPEYYPTKQIIERFLKDGIGEDTLNIEKVKSEHKGKTYEITGKTKTFIDDFVAFAKQDKDLKPMLQSFVDNDPHKRYKNIDEVAEALIVEILDLKPDENLKIQITMKSGKITHINDGHRDITIVSE